MGIFTNRIIGYQLSEQYYRKVKKIWGSSLIGYWPVWDGFGSSVARDISGNNRNGIYNNVILGQSGIGDGRTSGLYNGSTSFINIYSSTLANAFNGLEGLLITCQRLDASWTEGINIL